ncbi:MAG: non-canonical purine NTP pyrophosphatase [Candidatus Thermoplasmatota archaeon]|nr:non-canonical purine NTP pyrophosphatase [Candidatus Thermoplasmatota archaeon]
MDKTVWFLTSNPGKLAEAAHYFAQHGMVVRGLDVPAGAVIEPQASSLEEVAKAKLRQAMDHLPHHNAVVLVEDAGLFVDALDGFPGVYSSYVHETVGNLGMIRLLSHLQSEDPVQAKRLRSASFQAVAAMWDGETILIGRGVCKGSIALESQGEGGFGYDPIFVPLDLDEHGEALDPGTLGAVSTHGQTFGVVDADTKHRFSHRRRALDDLIGQAQRLVDR